MKHQANAWKSFIFFEGHWYFNLRMLKTLMTYFDLVMVSKIVRVNLNITLVFGESNLVRISLSCLIQL